MRSPASRRAPRFIVSGQHPFRQLVLGLLAGASLAAVGLVAFGLQTGLVTLPSQEVRADDGPKRMLETRIGELSTEKDRLASELVVLRRQQQVERQAEQSAATHLRDLQDQISTLRQELAFYRGIVAGKPGRGFEVQSFAAFGAVSDGSYRFRVVLTNDSKDAKVHRGFVSFSVDGEQDGNPVRLSLSELAGRGAPGFEFRFRTYEKVEGRLSLPDGFTPRVVNIEVTGADGVVSGVKRSFDWPVDSG